MSFNGNKLITTGGGGALLTNDAELAQRARHLSTTAKLPHPWEFDHDAIGWNDRLPNLNAAIGVAQLEDLDRRLEVKRKLAECYEVAMAGLVGQNYEVPPGCTTNHWLVSLRFISTDPLEAARHRQQLLESAHGVGLLLRPVWKLLNELPMYISAPCGPLPIAQEQVKRLVNLPSSPQLLQ